MGSAFFSDYVRNIYGQNRYLVSNTFEPADDDWAAIIYDWTAGSWEYLYESAVGATCQGASPIPCGEGWNLFETHYPVGNTCPAVPQMSAAYIAVGGSYASSSNSYADSEGQCFTGSPNPYIWDLNDANYYWTVTGG